MDFLTSKAPWVKEIKMCESQTNLSSLIALASDDLEALGGVEKLSDAKKVIDYFFGESPRNTIARISESQFPDELLTYWTKKAAGKSFWNELEKILTAIDEWDTSLIFTGRNSQEAVDILWSALVIRWIERGEYRRAWDELKRAFRGVKPILFDPYDSGMPPTQGSTSISMSAVTPLIEKIFELMLSKSLVTDGEFTKIGSWPSVQRFPHIPEIPGWPLLVAFGGHDIGGVPNKTGHMILKIVAALNLERNAKRKNKGK